MNTRIRNIGCLIPTLLLTSLGIPARAQEVVIPDPGLNAAVREALQIPVGPLTERALLDLIVLDAHSRNVRRIDGLEAARNLLALDLSANLFTNFSLPGELTNLATLDLSFNPLTNCIIPSGLTNLAKLILETNFLRSFALPAGLTGLAELFLDGNQLTSLTLLPDMTQLTTLVLDGNPPLALVLPESLAATNLADTVVSLRGQGFSVFTYPLTVQLIRLRQPIGAFQFAVTGPPGVYAVLASPDLADWSELGVVTNELGKIVFTDTTAHLSPQKFYRARLVP